MKYNLGDKAEFSKTVTESDVIAFAGVTGDFNPVHLDKEKAKRSLFGERVAQGALSVGFISAVLGTKLPGEGTVYLSQEVKFKRPVKIGDTVTAKAEIIEVIDENKNIYKLSTSVFNQFSELVVDGIATVMVPQISDDSLEQSSFYSPYELQHLGLKSVGENVLISRNAVLYNPEKLEIGNNVRIDDFTTISGNVKLGNYIHIAQFCGLYGGEEGIEMHDFSGLSSRVVIYAISNDYSGESMTNPMVPPKYKVKDKNEKVILEKHVIVGTMSVILPGVIIGEGTSIGSMTMVGKSLDSWGIYVGCPAKKIKDRSRKLLELEKLMTEEKGGGYNLLSRRINKSVYIFLDALDAS